MDEAEAADGAAERAADGGGRPTKSAEAAGGGEAAEAAGGSEAAEAAGGSEAVAGEAAAGQTTGGEAAFAAGASAAAGGAREPEPAQPGPGPTPASQPEPGRSAPLDLEEDVPIIRARVRTLTDFERAAYHFEGGPAAPQREPAPRGGDPSPTGRFLRDGLLSALQAPFLRSLLRVPLKKVAIWASFLGLIYVLRDFFGLIFLTFVISYITATIVARLTPYFTDRKVPVVLVFLAIVTTLVGIGVATVPRAARQGQAQLKRLARIKDPRRHFEVWLAEMFGLPAPPVEEHAKGRAHGREEAKTDEARTDAAGTDEAKTDEPTKTDEAKTEAVKTDEAKTEAVKTDEAKTEAVKTDEAARTEGPKTGATKTGVASAEGAKGDADPPADEESKGGWRETMIRYIADPEANQALAEALGRAAQEFLIPTLKSLLKGIYVAVAYVLAALVFSFMIVWDLPRLGQGVRLMERSRLGDVWGEVAPSIATFFTLLGRAFEAQTMIALVNTAITSVGLWLLGIPGIGFLAMIVFVCSFIPIVGMILSTVPMCLVALQVEGGGMGLVIGVVVMVGIAHAIEAYVLNPRIYGAHMNLHPLAVLIVLYLGQHLFGVWGLVMGVPMATYVWRHLIMGDPDEYGPSAAAEDEPLPEPQAA
ncbi:MAG: AI-2E family transporter [Planctomycetota bacterium]